MNFERYCLDKILNCLKGSIAYIKWESQISPNFWHGRFDLFGQYENKVYIIELEFKREDPATNIIKVFRAVDENLQILNKTKICFIHIFSDFFNLKKEKRINAEFVGKKMSKEFNNLEYISMDFNAVPPVRGASFPSNTDRAIKNLTIEIKELIKNLENI